MIVNCRQCGGPFNAKPSHIRKGGGAYCSKTCMTSGRRAEMFAPVKKEILQEPCAVCGAPVRRSAAVHSYITRRGGRFFCSRPCYEATVEKKGRTSRWHRDWRTYSSPRMTERERNAIKTYDGYAQAYLTLKELEKAINENK